MSTYGIIFIDLVGIGMLLLILDLLRTKKLNINYAVIWVLAICAMMAIISVPSFLELLPTIVGAKFEASALSLLAFIFIMLVLIFFSVQLTIISRRQTRLIQSIALQELLMQEKETSKTGTSLDETG
jgi:hypothetical protein